MFRPSALAYITTSIEFLLMSDVTYSRIRWKNNAADQTSKKQLNPEFILILEVTAKD